MKFIVWYKDPTSFLWEESGHGPLSETDANKVAKQIRGAAGESYTVPVCVHPETALVDTETGKECV